MGWLVSLGWFLELRSGRPCAPWLMPSKGKKKIAVLEEAVVTATVAVVVAVAVACPFHP